MIKLKPCQCGSTFYEIITDYLIFSKEVGSSNTGYKIRCQACGGQTCWWHSRQEAIDAWDNRPVEDALVGQIEQKERKLERVLNAAQTARGIFRMAKDLCTDKGCRENSKEGFEILDRALSDQEPITAENEGSEHAQSNP